jgi:murein DD-endopeptidase MepM/ murein hydrolase activator NlpD
VEAAETSTGVNYSARNDSPAPAQVELNFELLQNLRLTDSVPLLREVPPGETVLLTRLRRVDPQATVGTRPVVEIDLGSSQTQPDPDHRYGLPFGGTEPRTLIGGYGGGTHMAENAYSLDFGLPTGTPVLAARGGVVVEVQDGFTETGMDPDLLGQANLVAIAHADGTLASYGHLSAGILVAVGEEVVRGQRLGLSGSTGFSGQPHLHFHVGKFLVGGGYDHTIPVEFEDGDGAPLDLEEGRRYEPPVEAGRLAPPRP